MLLTYSKDRFVPDIIDGIKIHTLREDPKKRWRAGMSIQHWRGNPRNNRGCIKPYCFLNGECKGVQEIRIGRVPICPEFPQGVEVLIEIDRIYSSEWLKPEQIELLIKNDGLTIDEFRDWFVPEDHSIWNGRIIHFTDFRY